MNIYKKICYCLCGCILFFWSISFVEAKSFKIQSTVTVAEIPGNNSSNPKYDDSGNKAYCSDHDYSFNGYGLNGDCFGACTASYIVDEAYGQSNECSYGSSKNVDCSRFIGYIIAHGENYFMNEKRYGEYRSWFWTQATVWTYLANFAPSNLNLSNSTASSWYGSYSDIRTVISRAWSEYSANNVSTVTYNDVNFSFDYSDTNFYYVPSTSACNSGFYKTKSITVTNLEEQAINVVVSVNNLGVSICNESGCYGNSKSIPLTKKGTSDSKFTFYLKSSVDKNETINLNVNASYEKSITSEKKSYDSERYYINANLNPKGQGLIVMTNSVSGINVSEKHSKSINVNFSKTKISRTTCKTSGNLDTNNSKTNPTGKICASSENVKTAADYTAEFDGCTCFGLDLGNDRYVNIIVKEAVTFKYGNLVPNDVLYAGGGFAFDEEAIPTQYGVKITWEYADSRNGVPYYYNGKNLSDSDARNVSDLIKDKLLEKLKENINELELSFSSLDSNDYTNKNSYIYNLSIDLKNYSYDASKRQYVFESGVMKLKNAYFSESGEVEYGVSKENYSIDGGNKYYVPMGYTASQFPFSVAVSDLSIVDGIKFWYEAECNVTIKDKYKNLYYRSIDVSNPFPKSENISANVPENWRVWYCGTGTTCNGNLSNQNRIKNTYQNYPDNPLYRATLNSGKIDLIRSITSNYTSWSMINKDGSSDFVVDMDLFEKVSNNKSYCEIGQFKAECDELR